MAYRCHAFIESKQQGGEYEDEVDQEGHQPFKLDDKLDTRPIFILIGLVLGLVLAFWGFYQMVIPLIKDNSKQGHKRERR